jgi:hypothetical protein
MKPRHLEEHPTEEEIDQTLEATFPASDPPGWTLGLDRFHPPRSEGKPDWQAAFRPRAAPPPHEP